MSCSARLCSLVAPSQSEPVLAQFAKPGRPSESEPEEDTLRFCSTFYESIEDGIAYYRLHFADKSTTIPVTNGKSTKCGPPSSRSLALSA